MSIVRRSTEHTVSEADPVYETVCSLEYRAMIEVQKNSNSEWIFFMYISYVLHLAPWNEEEIDFPMVRVCKPPFS